MASTKRISEYGPKGRIARKKAAARNWGWRKALRETAKRNAQKVVR